MYTGRRAPEVGRADKDMFGSLTITQTKDVTQTQITTPHCPQDSAAAKQTFPKKESE